MAQRLPGAKAVLTGEDFKGWKWGWMPKTREEEPLAADYLGEAVAAVAAADEDTAEGAARMNMIVFNKMGMKKDGSITAMQSRVIADGGAHTAIGPLTMSGFMKCTHMVIADECGVPLNPINVEAQNQGAAMQGMGQVMYEEFKMDHGKTLNSTLVDYKMPLASDIPNIKVVDIITQDPDGSFGATSI